AIHFSTPSVGDGNAEYVNSSGRTRARRIKSPDKNAPVYLAIVYMSIRLSLISFLNEAHSPLLERALCAGEKLSRETGASLLRPLLRRMDPEFSNHPADDAAFRRRIRLQSFLPAAMKTQNLADHHIQQSKIRIFHVPARNFQRDCKIGAAANAGSRILGAGHQLARPQFLRIQLRNQVQFIGPNQPVHRKETDDQRAIVDETHRTVPQTQIGLRHGRHLATRHLEQFESAFARGAELASISQKDHPADIARNEITQAIGPRGQQTPGRQTKPARY